MGYTEKMPRAGWCLVLVLCVTPVLRAADLSVSPENSRDSGSAPLPFPLAPLLQASRLRDFPWRPDWPLSLPPDAFTARPRSPGSLPSSVIVAADGAEYVLRRNGAGGLRAFPWLFGGAFLNVSFSGNPRQYAGFRVGEDGAEPLWNAEFLEFSPEDPALPVLCRLVSGGLRFFVRLEYRGRYTAETWFDASGAALGNFECTWSAHFANAPDETPRLLLCGWTDFQTGRDIPAEDPSAAAPEEGGGPAPSGVPARTEYFYDSYGNLGGVLATDGSGAVLLDCAARFRDGRPLYWDRPVLLPGNTETGDQAPAQGTFRFQWDERGFPARFSGAAGGANFDSRYEYVSGSDGNWTARKDTVLTRREGYFVPGIERNVTRRILWQAAE